MSEKNSPLITIAETLIAVVILGILAAIVGPQFQSARESAKARESPVAQPATCDCCKRPIHVEEQ